MTDIISPYAPPRNGPIDTGYRTNIKGRRWKVYITLFHSTQLPCLVVGDDPYVYQTVGVNLENLPVRQPLPDELWARDYDEQLALTDLVAQRALGKTEVTIKPYNGRDTSFTLYRIHPHIVNLLPLKEYTQ